MVLRWYENRRRNKLEFPGLSKETVQRHYDLMVENDFSFRVLDDANELFRKRPCEDYTNYVTYLIDKKQSRLEERAVRFLINLVDTIFPD